MPPRTNETVSIFLTPSELQTVLKVCCLPSDAGGKHPREYWTIEVLHSRYHSFPLPPTYDAGSHRVSVKVCALKEEVDKMLKKGTLEKVQNPGLGFCSRLFVVQKVSGRWRQSHWFWEASGK